MSMKTLEAEILAEAREVTGRPKLRQKDIQEWRTSEIEPHENERVLLLPKIKIYVSILTSALV